MVSAVPPGAVYSATRRRLRRTDGQRTTTRRHYRRGRTHGGRSRQADHGGRRRRAHYRRAAAPRPPPHPANATASAAAPTTAAAAAPTTASAAAPTTAPAAASNKPPVVLKMARNAEPGIFVPWLIDDNTALFTHGQRLRRPAARDQGRRQRRAGAGDHVGHVRRRADLDVSPAARCQVLGRHAADVQRRQGLARSRPRRPAKRLERQLQGDQGDPGARPDDGQASS